MHFPTLAFFSGFVFLLSPSVDATQKRKLETTDGTDNTHTSESVPPTNEGAKKRCLGHSGVPSANLLQTGTKSIDWTAYSYQTFLANLLATGKHDNILMSTKLHLQLDLPIRAVEEIESRLTDSYNEQSGRYTSMETNTSQAYKPKNENNLVADFVYTRYKALLENEKAARHRQLYDRRYSTSEQECTLNEIALGLLDHLETLASTEKSRYAEPLLCMLNRIYTDPEGFEASGFIVLNELAEPAGVLEAIYLVHRSQEIRKNAEEAFKLSEDGPEYCISNEMRRLATLRFQMTQLTWTTSIYSALHLILETEQRPWMRAVTKTLSDRITRLYPAIWKHFLTFKKPNKEQNAMPAAPAEPSGGLPNVLNTPRPFPPLERAAKSSTPRFGDYTAILECRRDGTLIDIYRAARTSYGKARTEPSEAEAEKLVQKLKEWGHRTPFEHVTYQFKMIMPFFAWRHFARYRTAQISELEYYFGHYYLPSTIRLVKNKDTGKPDPAKPGVPANTNDIPVVREFVRDLQELYGQIHRGILQFPALADVITPMGSFVEVLFSIDGNNIQNVLNQRLAKGAQEETRKVALLMNDMVGNEVRVDFPTSQTPS